MNPLFCPHTTSSPFTHTHTPACTHTHTHTHTHTRIHLAGSAFCAQEHGVLGPESGSFWNQAPEWIHFQKRPRVCLRVRNRPTHSLTRERSMPRLATSALTLNPAASLHNRNNN